MNVNETQEQKKDREAKNDAAEAKRRKDAGEPLETTTERNARLQREAKG